MKFAILLLSGIAIGIATPTLALEGAVSVGRGNGIQAPRPGDPPCDGSLLLSYDGSAENGYAWSGGGEVEPYYGAFAEGYEAVGTVCGASFHFTQTGRYNGQLIDVYVWDSDEGDPQNPGAVILVTPGVAIAPPAMWPMVSQHDVALADVQVNGRFFVGYWGDWPGFVEGWYCAADLDGPGGMPRTNIAPGVWPEDGWQDLSIIWGSTQAMGIGAYVHQTPVPVVLASWGRIKSTYVLRP